MDISELNQTLKQFHSYEDSAIQACMEYCQDISIPLEERWEFFVNEAIGKETSEWVAHFDSLQQKYSNAYTIEDQIYADDEIHRCEIIDVKRLAANLKYMQEKHPVVTDVIIANFKEEVLQKYLGAVRFDW